MGGVHTGGCLLLHESSAERFKYMSFLYYFHSTIRNHLSIAISMSPEWMVALNRFNCIHWKNRFVVVFLSPKGDVSSQD